MGFVAAVRSAFANYANFRGRATRSQYWWFVLFYLILVIVLSAIRLSALSALVELALIVPNISLQVRRHHDAGRSGWWTLTSLVPLWGLILLLYPTKTVGNRYGDGTGGMIDAPAPTTRSCAACGKMALPGQHYCTGCGAPLP